MKKLITYGLYPFLLVLTIGLFVLTITYDWDLTRVFLWMAGFRLALLLLIEFSYPLKQEWKMTKKSFVRDLKWIVVNLITVGIIRLIIPLLAIDLSASNTGLLANTSIFTGAVITLLVFEFFQYWFHRISHNGIGNWKWLWKVHAPHHLPEEVYLLMHSVGHPINAIIIQGIIMGTLVLCGARSESIFIYTALMSLQGLVSHFNVEIKAGFLNYIFIGTELHRYHHSAKVAEAQNFGATISFWDLVFGTFYYQPNRVPDELGVANKERYPTSNEVLKVLKLPFKK